MTLKKIQIENVKGISNRTFELNIFPNKPSLLVAPNGFGKSSFASAFLSLQSNKISVQDHHLHKNQQDLESKLLIEYKCPQNIVHSLEANTTSNTISEHFSWFVINNQIKAKGIGRNIGGRTNVSADIAIEPVTLIDTIPDREDFSYSYQSQKADFGVNGKILPNISDCFKNLSFITSLVNYYDALDKMAQIRNQRRIDEIILDINNQSGTVSTLKKWIEENGIQKFSAIEPLDSLAKHILNSYLNRTGFVGDFLFKLGHLT